MHDLMKERCIYCGSDVFFDGGNLLIKCEKCGHTLVITKFENELNRMKEAIEEGNQAKADLEAARKEQQAANDRLFSVLSVLDDIGLSQKQEEETARQIKEAFSDNRQSQEAMIDLLYSLHGDIAEESDTLLNLISTLLESREEAGEKLELLQSFSERVLKAQDDLAARLRMQSEIVMQLQSMAVDAEKKQALVNDFMAWSQDIHEADYQRLKDIEGAANMLLNDQKMLDAKVSLLQLTADRHEKTLERFHSQWEKSKLEELRMLYKQAENFQYDRDYDCAEEYYRRIITKGGADAEIYWRLLLCHYCVSYQRSEDGTLVPIILNPDLTDPREMSLRRDFEASIRPEQREHYKEELSKIDSILDKYRQVHSDVKYDVFISVKQQIGGRATVDSDIASSLYDTLTEKGLKVFNSRRCKAEMAGKLYEPYIISALMSAKALIVVGTSAENMNAQWVKNEWSRFQWLQQRERQKTGKTDRVLLCYLAMGMSPRDIPKALNPSRQAVIDGINADKEISTALKHLIPVKPGPAPRPLPENEPERTSSPVTASPDNGKLFMIMGIVIGILVLALILSMSGLLRTASDKGNTPVPVETAAHETEAHVNVTEAPETEAETEIETEVVIKTKQIGEIMPIKVTASSQLGDMSGKSYTPYNLLDHDQSTAYVEGVAGSGAGEFVTFTFDTEYEIHQITWYPGYQASNHLFNKNGYPEKILLEFSDGTSFTSTAYGASLGTKVKIDFETPVIADQLTVTILEATVGFECDDTCISGFEFYGTDDLD